MQESPEPSSTLSEFLDAVAAISDPHLLVVATDLVDRLHDNEQRLRDQRRLLDELVVHEAIQAAVLRVQRIVSLRQPIGTILQAITEEAVELSGADLAGVSLRSRSGPDQRWLAAGTDAGRALAELLPDDLLRIVGDRAIAASEQRLIPATFETVDGDRVDAIVAGSPVYDGDRAIGCLVALSLGEPGPAVDGGDGLLETFASQASIALADANKVSELQNAFHDHLTGLPNRALFQERCDQAVERSNRMGTTTALLFLDLDRFKSVNDTLGHAAGDALLRNVGRALIEGSRLYDSVARIGGDEFAILLEDTTATAAASVASRLLDRISRVVDPSGFRSQAGASIGIALSGPECRTTDEFLRRADIAMYAVKASGRGGVAVFDNTMSQSRPGGQGLAEALAGALANDELLVYYQPIVDLQTRRISGVEALVRWQHHERGLLAPNSFIDAAEETGMIVPVGRRILDIASAQVASWRRDLPEARDLSLSVNLSVRQLEHDQIEADVSETLRLTDLDPTALTLEVTESIFVNNAASARTRLHGLKALGIRLAIDDFGTGFSSLGYIHNYPFDILKIDRSFVKGIGSTANNGAIVRTMLALAKQLSMTVVAEGIESPAELAQLRALRCSYGQGFLFSKPMAADDFERLLTSDDRRLDVSRP
ncbi:MAG: putative bifunctional diguanylate cyclase/phosphodiesterase [Acidimicrobiales bacterium]